MMFQNKKVLFGILIVAVAFFNFSTCSASTHKIPKVINGKIYFLDGKTMIEIVERDIFHIFAGQNRLVYISEQTRENHVGEYKISFFDFTGKEIAQSVIYPEFNFVFAETAQMVLAGNVSMMADKSYLYDLDGNLLNTLTSGLGTKDIGITGDEKYFWFASNDLRPLRPGEELMLSGWSTTPYNHIMVFDTAKGEFAGSFSGDGANISFTVGGREYSITTSRPDMPG